MKLPSGFRKRLAIPEQAVANFRIYPIRKANRGMFFRVLVFRDRASLRKELARRDTYYGCDPEDYAETLGQFSCYKIVHFKKGKRGRTSPEFGCMFLSLDDLRFEILSHECGHALWAWIRRRVIYQDERQNVLAILDNDSQTCCNAEEATCRFIGRAVAKLEQQLKKRKLFGKTG
jgi:hypothetical protein